MKYSVTVYHDKAKNAEGQWYIKDMEVADVFYEADKLEVKPICQFLKRHGWIESADMRKVDALIGLDHIEVFEKKGNVPLCRLDRVRRV